MDLKAMLTQNQIDIEGNYMSKYDQIKELPSISSILYNKLISDRKPLTAIIKRWYEYCGYEFEYEVF